MLFSSKTVNFVLKPKKLGMCDSVSSRIEINNPKENLKNKLLDRVEIECNSDN